MIYDVGEKDRTFFFLLSGFVKVGTIIPDGHELIYDVRKGGDVVGELCLSQHEHADRAVALEDTKAVRVPYDEVMEVIKKQLGLLDRLVELFCRVLTEAYEQVNILAMDGTVHRLEGGFFHDGRFATLIDVVQHYNSFFGLGLNDKQAHDLVEYLKSL